MRTAARFRKTLARTRVATWLVAAAVGCGLDLRGEGPVDPREAAPSADDEAGTVASGSSDEAIADGGGSDGAMIDQGPDDPADSTTAPSASVPEAAVGQAGADAAGTLPEAGPSYGTMSCPADSDAGAPCDLSTSVCCACLGCFPPYPTGCFPALTGCVGVVFSGVYARLTCGDSTNCGAGSTCCAQFDATGALTGSSCLSSCPAGSAAQLCTSNTPCDAGTSCRPLASAPGFSTCQ
jgi:hypothetical protein